jgi:hypothetical protein
MESCKGKFTAIGEESKTFLKRLITIEETWIHYCDELERKESSKRWKHVNFSLPKKNCFNATERSLPQSFDIPEIQKRFFFLDQSFAKIIQK